MEAHVPEGYPGTFQASGIGFPVPGCWEINATAGGSGLRVVVEVLPRLYRPTTGSCADLTDTLTYANTVAVGVVKGTTDDRPGFVWQTIAITQTLTGPAPSEEVIEVLQDATEEPLLRTGESYLLFLHSNPGQPWRIHCGHRSLARVDGDLLTVLDPHLQAEPLWAGLTLSELENHLQEPLVDLATPIPRT